MIRSENFLKRKIRRQEFVKNNIKLFKKLKYNLIVDEIVQKARKELNYSEKTVGKDILNVLIHTYRKSKI